MRTTCWSASTASISERRSAVRNDGSLSGRQVARERDALSSSLNGRFRDECRLV